VRLDNASFRAQSGGGTKSPQYVVELAFDSDNTILWYFTSHANTPTADANTTIYGVLSAIGGTSQTLNPDTANNTIGEMSFDLIDKNSQITTTLGDELELGRSTRLQRVRFFMGFEGFTWDDFVLIQTQLVKTIDFQAGAYQFKCQDIQREMRKELFQVATTNLQTSLTDSVTTIDVYSTAQFQMVEHGSSYTDSPNATVGYIRVEDEIIKYTGTTPTSFTGCTRGALNTRAIAHLVDQSATQDRRTLVSEYVYLEMPAVKMAHSLLTGQLLGQPGKTLPDSWNLGIQYSRHFDDDSSNQLDATFSGPLIIKAPQPRTDSEALLFDGVNDFMSVSYNSIFDFERTDAFTVMVRAKVNSAECNLVEKTIVPGAGYRLLVVASKLRVTIAQGSDLGLRLDTVANVNDNDWHTFGFTYDGSGAISGLKIYIDGSQALTTTVDATALTTSIKSTTALYFGSRAGTSRFLSGAICEAWLYNRALSSTEVLNLFLGRSISTSNKIAHWSANSSGYIKESDFTSIGTDLWNPLDDEVGFVVRFESPQQTEGKAFIEKQLMLLLGAFMPIYTDGAIGLKRMAALLAGASYVAMLDETNIVSYGALMHDFTSLHNIIQIKWNFEPIENRTTRTSVFIDNDSITVHGESDILNLVFDGLHGSRHSTAMLAQRFDSIRDRYTGPPLRLTVAVLPSLNTLEVGDVVRVNLTNLRDFVANSTIDRSFEVQNIQIDWISGLVNLTLFASSQTPGALSATTDTAVLTSAWYISQGTNLSSVLTISGSNPGHVISNGSLTGTSDLTATPSIYYYVGDLIIDSGVTVSFTNNVQLRIKGNLQVNGTISAVGTGLGGGAAIIDPISVTEASPGIRGFIGTTEAMGGWAQSSRSHSTRANPTVGIFNAVPPFNISWDGQTLSGLPTDLRGTSGGSGLPYAVGNESTFISLGAAGGSGGTGGGGLLVICRGLSIGAAGVINVSGDDGQPGNVSVSVDGQIFINGGSGAGGAPGALLIILDGSLTTATGLTENAFIANWGSTPITGDPFPAPDGPDELHDGDNVCSFYTGTGDVNVDGVPSLSGGRGGFRVQFVPADTAAQEDPSATVLLPPSALTATSGTSELLLNSDGTVIPRIKVTWTASLDPRTLAYDVQFKESTGTVWQSMPSVFADTQVWLTPVKDGVTYDVRVRAAANLRLVSAWITLTGHLVVGKTAPPSNILGIAVNDVFLTWQQVTDLDLLGYIVRYNSGANSTWDTATPAHAEGFLTDNRFDTRDLVGGSVTLLVKAIDTSGNESVNVASILTDLRPAAPISFLISRQPDGTREFTWGFLTEPADLFGIRIRYFSGTTSTWESMTALHEGVLISSPFETNQLAAGTYTFAAKAVDTAGNESASAIFITTTIGDPRIAGAIEDVNEGPTWVGSKVSCHVDSATGYLVANGTGTWSTAPHSWGGWASWNATPVNTIQYTDIIDVGVVAKFSPLIATNVSGGNAMAEEAHSSDGSTYTSFTSSITAISARFIKTRVTVSGSYPVLKSMRTVLSANPIVEFIEDRNSATLTGSFRIAAGDVRVQLVNSYSIIKNVNVTLQSVGAGFSWELIDKSTVLGPRIKIYNSANTLTDAVFDAEVKGL
jgi:hypothetical protein